MDANMDKDDLATFLAKRATEEWNSGKNPYLLSKVHPELKENLVDYREIIDQDTTLKQFAASIPNLVKLVQHPEQRAKVGVVPPDVDFSFMPQSEMEPPDAAQRTRTQRGRNVPHRTVQLLDLLAQLDDEDISKIEFPLSVLIRFHREK